LLVHAGLNPDVQPSDIDEDSMLRQMHGQPFTQQVQTLARAKCENIAATVTDDALVLGCDSMFELDGALFGKPGTADIARERLQAMSGRSGVLHTGHWLARPAHDRACGDVASTTVHIAPLSTTDIDAYIGTGEPLQVAGSFTIDGIGGPFVAGVEGDPSNVVGCSLPLLRTLSEQLGVPWPTLWMSTLRR
jgi:septum formation protein